MDRSPTGRALAVILEFAEALCLLESLFSLPAGLLGEDQGISAEWHLSAAGVASVIESDLRTWIHATESLPDGAHIGQSRKPWAM